MAITIQLRNDTTANWTAANPVLAIGETGLDTDLNTLRFGDGVTAYLSLEVFNNAGALVTTMAGNLEVLIQDSGTGKRITKDNFSKDLLLQRTLEVFNDNGTLASGTFTPDCNFYNDHLLAVTGDITVEQPTATLTANQEIWGVIRLTGTTGNALTFPAASWDWGTDGEPASIEDTVLLGFTRAFGDTKTKIWAKDGYT